jgi:hypothetical protein
MYVFPAVGGRNVDHLTGNIEGLSMELSGEDKGSKGANVLDIGFWMNFWGRLTGWRQESYTRSSHGCVWFSPHFDVQRIPLGPVTTKGVHCLWHIWCWWCLFASWRSPVRHTRMAKTHGRGTLRFAAADEAKLGPRRGQAERGLVGSPDITLDVRWGQTTSVGNRASGSLMVKGLD